MKPKNLIPHAFIRAKLRQVWLWSWQRREAVKRANGKCEKCGAILIKKNVHHIFGIRKLNSNFNYYIKDLFCPPQQLQVLCKPCHKQEHKGAKKC